MLRDGSVLFAGTSQVRHTESMYMIGRLTLIGHSTTRPPFFLVNALPYRVFVDVEVEGLSQADASPFSNTFLNATQISRISQFQRHVLLL